MGRPATPSRRARAAAAVAVVLAAGLLALAPAASASAHDYLVQSTPKAGSTVTKPLSKVVLTFDDRVLDLSGDGSSNIVEVTHGTRHFETGCPTIADITVSVPVNLGGSGKYAVTWQIVSADGHVVTNSIDFDYTKPQDATAAAGAKSRPTCGDQSSSKAGSSGQTAAAGSGTSGSSSSSALPVALGVGGGIIVAALIVVAVVLTRSRASAGVGGSRGGGAAGGRGGCGGWPCRGCRRRCRGLRRAA